MRRVLAAFMLCAAPAALADSYDLQLWRLGRPADDNRCAGVTPPAGTPLDAPCMRFRAVATELALMLAPRPGAPAKTLGHSGFDFTAELAIAKVHGNARIGGQPYWVVSQFFQEAKNPPTTYLIPTLHVRKGLPFSFEIGSSIQWVPLSSMFMPGVEVRWAINEGLKYFPDFAVRGVGSRLVGNRDFDLTIAGFDFSLSKAFALGGMLNVTPWAGWGMLFFDAATGNMDFDPTQEFGQPGSTFTSITDDDANFKFGRTIGENRFHRFFGGIRIIAYVVDFGGYFTYAQVNRNALLGTNTFKNAEVWTFNGRLGVNF